MLPLGDYLGFCPNGCSSPHEKLETPENVSRFIFFHSFDIYCRWKYNFCLLLPLLLYKLCTRSTSAPSCRSTIRLLGWSSSSACCWVENWCRQSNLNRRACSISVLSTNQFISCRSSIRWRFEQSSVVNAACLTDKDFKKFKEVEKCTMELHGFLAAVFLKKLTLPVFSKILRAPHFSWSQMATSFSIGT